MATSCSCHYSSTIMMKNYKLIYQLSLSISQSLNFSSLTTLTKCFPNFLSENLNSLTVHAPKRVSFYSLQETLTKTSKKIQVTYFLTHLGAAAPTFCLGLIFGAEAPLGSTATRRFYLNRSTGIDRLAPIGGTTMPKAVARALSLSFHSIFLFYFAPQSSTL